MAPRSPCPVLLLGDLSCAELLPVVAHIRGRVRHGQLREAATISQAIATYRPGTPPPELVVACQSWSDQFAPAQIQRLMQWQPLAQLVCCYGPWCDSDGRTRDAWPFSVRVPAEDAVRQVDRMLTALERTTTAATTGVSSAPGVIADLIPIPWTASRTEVFASRIGDAAVDERVDVQWKGSESLAVASADRAWSQMIAHAFRQHGLACEPVQSSKYAGQASVLIWDADPAESTRLADLIDLRSKNPRLPVVAAVGFPRADLAHRLVRAGADRVWAKLTPLTTLREIVAQLVSGTVSLR